VNAGKFGEQWNHEDYLGVNMEATGNENIRSYELQSVTQTLDLIDMLITARGGMTLSRLSNSIGLNKNKVFRILSTLEQRGMVEKDHHCQYTLGATSFWTARRILSSKSILDHARPIMMELAAIINESVYLVTMVDGEGIFQDRIDCHQTIKTGCFLGNRFDFPDAAVEGSSFAQFDISGTCVFASRLNEEITTVSAALIDSNGKTTGAIVVLTPTFRMPTERIVSEITVPVSEAAKQLSGQLEGTADQNWPTFFQPGSHDLSLKSPVMLAMKQTNSVRADVMDQQQGIHNKKEGKRYGMAKRRTSFVLSG
jgi:DNA-binding IclR family transcriptional regulator